MATFTISYLKSTLHASQFLLRKPRDLCCMNHFAVIVNTKKYRNWNCKA